MTSKTTLLLKQLNASATTLLFLHLILFLFSFQATAQGDDCTTATPLLNLVNYCSDEEEFTNIGATPGSDPVPPCWTTPGPYEDVWFSFVAIGTDALIAVRGATMDQPHIVLYNGDCSSLAQQNSGCTNGIGGIPNSQIFVDQLVPGATYYIRVGTPNPQSGTFQLCINNFTPPILATADCDGAGELCNKNPVSVSNLAGGGNNPYESNGSCIPNVFTETNSIWYTWTCETAGTLTMDIVPANPNNDIDFVFFQLDTEDPCGPRTVIRCSGASCMNAQGSTGLSATSTDVSEPPGCPGGSDAYVQQVNMTAGTSYAVLIMNASANAGFTLNWGGTGTFVGPEAHINSPALTVCEGTPITFDGSASNNYTFLEWNFADGPGDPADADGPGPHVVDYPGPGTYTAILNAVDVNGCISVEAVTVTVNENITPEFDDIGPFCVDDPAPGLPATSIDGISGIWSPALISTAVSGTTNYTFTPNAGSGDCVVNAVIPVTVSEPTVPVFDLDTEICNGSPAPDLPTTSVNNVTGTWSAAVSNIVSGSYTFTPDAGTCASTIDIDIVVHPLPVVNVSNNGPLCANDTLRLEANNIPGAVYEWQGPGNFSSNAEDPVRPMIGHNQAGTYMLQVTDDNGCIGVGSTDVTVNGPIAAFTASNTEINQLNTEVTFYNNSENAISYSWTFGDEATSTAVHPVHTFSEDPGNHTVVLTAMDENGCSDQAVLVIVVKEEQIIYVPNAFTPDGDEFNNEFKPVLAEGFDLYSYTLLIYNRWGEVIFESMNTDAGWDGTYHGYAVQEGTYTWTIRVKNRMEDKYNTYNGHVLVIR